MASRYWGCGEAALVAGAEEGLRSPGKEQRERGRPGVPQCPSWEHSQCLRTSLIGLPLPGASPCGSGIQHRPWGPPSAHLPACTCPDALGVTHVARCAPGALTKILDRTVLGSLKLSPFYAYTHGISLNANMKWPFLTLVISEN